MAGHLIINPHVLANTPGVTDGSEPTPTMIGEYVSSVQSVAVGNAFTLNQFGNMTSIELTAGDWEIRGVVNLGTLALVTDVQMALSVFSGNTTTDHVLGDNVLGVNIGSGLNNSASIACGRLLLSAPATLYLKARFAGAKGNVLTGRVTARRVR